MSVVVVSGSSSGFGQAIALGMLERGHTVVATVRDLAKGEPLVAAASRAGLPVPSVVELDITVATSRQLLIDQAVDAHGTIDVLVNNAGVLYIGSLEDSPIVTIETLFATNVIGPIGLTQLVLPHMRRRGCGRIVNVSAIGGVICTPFMAGYVASKHALEAATAALDLEIRPLGLRAVTILPGAFNTPIAAKAPPITDTDAYRTAAARFRHGLFERINAAPSDLTPIVDAVAAAAFDPEPAQRTVVASPGTHELLAPAIAELNRLHDLEAQRLDLNDPSAGVMTEASASSGPKAVGKDP